MSIILSETIVNHEGFSDEGYGCNAPLPWVAHGGSCPPRVVQPAKGTPHTSSDAIDNATRHEGSESSPTPTPEFSGAAGEHPVVNDDDEDFEIIEGPSLFNPARPDRVYWLILSVVPEAHGACPGEDGPGESKPGAPPPPERPRTGGNHSRSNTRIMKGRHPQLKCLLHNMKKLHTKITRPNAPNWKIRCISGPFSKGECQYRRSLLARRRNVPSRLMFMALLSAIDCSHIFFGDAEEAAEMRVTLEKLRERTRGLDRRALLDTLEEFDKN